jgi:hypothetical protein
MGVDANDRQSQPASTSGAGPATVADYEPVLSRRVQGGHWLLFDDERHITGCCCGFAADPDDAGYGDSVLDHFEQVVRAECQLGVDNG